MNSALVLAKAIYDNDAESKEELAFRRGDVVTVLEQNTSGLDGWWLCSLHGKQGIAPGNRLRLLSGLHSQTITDTSESAYDVPPSHAWMNSGNKQEDEEYDVPKHQLNLDTVDGVSPSEVYDVPKASGWNLEETYDTPIASLSHSSNHLLDVYNVPTNLSIAPDPKELYDVPPIVSRDLKQSDEVYDVPTLRNLLPKNEMILVQNPEEVYDVPLSMQHDSTLISSPVRHDSVDSDVVYDIPQSNRTLEGSYISSGLNSIRRMKKEIKEYRQQQQNLLVNTSEQLIPPIEYVYDVPPQVTRDRNDVVNQPSPDDVVDGLIKHLSATDIKTVSNSKGNSFSLPSHCSTSSIIEDHSNFKELNLTLDNALSKLIMLKQNLEDSVSMLLTLVKENWRKIENISSKINEIQKYFMDVVISVNQFIVYARGATANSYINLNKEKAPQQVHLGLQRFLKPLEEDLKMLTGALTELESSHWDISKLAVDNNEDGSVLDEVDSFVMTSRAVSDDADQMAVYIHSHAQYIFRKNPNSLSVQPISSKSHSSESIARPSQEIQALQARPLPVPPTTNAFQLIKTNISKDNDAWLDDYDYVALPENEENTSNIKNSVNQNLLAGLNKRKTQLIGLNKDSNSRKELFNLSPQEKEILKNLEINLPDLLQSLSTAIDQYIKAISSGEPPPSFVALGKHVILCAHKLVFVGDCVHQHLVHGAAKNFIKEQCAAMCSVLKKTVTSIKIAALQWPSVVAVQDMIDKMCDITTCAQQIKTSLSGVLPSN